MSAEAIQRELDRHKADWERGEHEAVILAFVLCSKNRLAIPEWLHDAVLDELACGFEDRHASKAARADKHRRRHFLASFWLLNRKLLPSVGHPATREGAFEMTAEMLPQDNVTSEAVERSYERVESERKRPQKTG